MSHIVQFTRRRLLQTTSGVAGLLATFAVLPSTVLAAADKARRRIERRHGHHPQRAVFRSMLANPAPPPPPRRVSKGLRVAGHGDHDETERED